MARVTVYSRHIIVDPTKDPLPDPIRLTDEEHGQETERKMKDICKELNTAMKPLLSENARDYFEGFSSWPTIERDSELMWPVTWHWIATAVFWGVP